MGYGGGFANYPLNMHMFAYVLTKSYKLSLEAIFLTR